MTKFSASFSNLSRRRMILENDAECCYIYIFFVALRSMFTDFDLEARLWMNSACTSPGLREQYGSLTRVACGFSRSMRTVATSPLRQAL